MSKKAFVRYSTKGKIVPGSLIVTGGSCPKGPAKWKEVPVDLCCETPCAAESFTMQILPWNIKEGVYEFAFGMRVGDGNTVAGTIEWGDGTSESFDLSSPYETTTYLFHDYTTNEFTPQTVKVSFTSLQGFQNLEIGQGDLTGDLLSVSNLQGVFIGSSIEEVDADGQDNLVSLDVSNLPIQRFYATDCPTLHFVNVSGCTSLVDTELFEDDIYQLDFTGCSSLQAALVFLNSNLNRLIIDGCPNLEYLDAGDCALNRNVVDNILMILDDNGLTGGEVYLGGGTNAAPSGAGATAASNLIGKGWTVSTN